MQDEDTFRQLEQSLSEALAQRTQNPEPPLANGKLAAGQRLEPPTMRLPEELVREAAIIVFDFWQTHSPQPKITWDQLPTRFQIMWLKIIRVVLEMTVSVQLTDIHRFFEHSNGDMGAAFASALRRYAAEILNIRITP